MRKQKGITLVALVITIIVLLILAGVSISMISGDDGIATKASQAAEKTKEKSDEELDKLASVDDYIQDKVNGTKTEQDPGQEPDQEPDPTPTPTPDPEPEVETITITFDNGNSSYKFFSLTKDDTMVYAEELDSYQITVPAGSKVERPVRGSYMNYEFTDFPVDFETYERWFDVGVSVKLTLDELPKIVGVYSPDLDTYVTVDGTSIDIDNFYPTEDMTVICYDDR